MRLDPRLTRLEDGTLRAKQVGDELLAESLSRLGSMIVFEQEAMCAELVAACPCDPGRLDVCVGSLMGIDWWQGPVSVDVLPDGLFSYPVTERPADWNVFRVDGELLVCAYVLALFDSPTGDIKIRMLSLTTSPRSATKMLMTAGLLLMEAQELDELNPPDESLSE